MEKATGLGAREATVALLGAVIGEGQMMAQALAAPGLMKGLAAQDKARAQRLALQVIRQLEPVERLLTPLLRKEPPLAVMNILRLAVIELAAGAAAHGVVNSAVELTRLDKRTAPMAGLVNAVLRKLPKPVVLDGSVQKLPRWMRQPMVHAYGRDAVAAIEAIHSLTPPVDITPHGQPLPEGLLLPNGSIRLIEAGQISTLPGYEAGAFWVQDAAATFAAALIDARPGEAVLDLCAAPGGKTMQMAATGAEVTALDISGPRMARLAENLGRTGLSAHLVVADALQWVPQRQFDAILLDAPCSATGTVRRHPELPFIKDGSDVPELVALQMQLIERALGWLKPDGRLVFCTCSLLPTEGEEQLDRIIASHPEVMVEKPAMAGIETGWITPAGGLRLRPDYWSSEGGMDGFFMVRLRKT